MGTVQTDWGVSSSARLTGERLLGAYLRVLSARGWQERFAPLAQHMAERRLVRAPSDAGAALRRLDAEVLREALSRMLREQWDDGSLIYDLVLEGMEPAHVAAERGTSRPAPTEQLRDAIARLALEYEHVAYGESKQEQVCAALARGRKR